MTVKLTFEFQFTSACFPETSGSFTAKSFSGTLPILKERPETFVDCCETRIPEEGPDITSKIKVLPALPRRI